MRTVPQEYGKSAKLLHWLVAGLVLIIFPLGLIMADMDGSPLQGTFIDVHEIIGVAIFVLAVVRLVRRGAVGSPEPVAGTPLERLAATAIHIAAYALLLAVPLVGWALVSAGGHQIELGLLDIPALVAPNEELKEVLEEVHGALAWGLVAIVGVHVAAALKHHFFDHDETLVRMLPDRG